MVVISNEFWTKRFGRSPTVIGKTINLNGTPMTVIGVNPPGFTGAFGAQRSPEVFLPFSMQPVVAPWGATSLLTSPDLWWVMMMARVQPGVNNASAQAQMNDVFEAAVRGTMTVEGRRTNARSAPAGRKPRAERRRKAVEADRCTARVGGFCAFAGVREPREPVARAG